MKMSRLVVEGTLVSMGPRQKWNGGKVLRGPIQELMGRAGDAVEGMAYTASRVVSGLVAADK